MYRRRADFFYAAESDELPSRGGSSDSDWSIAQTWRRKG